MSLAFSTVSEKLADTFEAALPIGLRPYGKQASDLAIDFHQPLRPQLETDLLCCCAQDAAGNAIHPDFFWHLGLSQRIEALLSVVSLSLSQPPERSAQTSDLTPDPTPDPTQIQP